MNRENKRKLYEKGYYKTHPCNEAFTCKVCGWIVTPEGAGSEHRNHCPNCLSSLHLDVEPGTVPPTVEALWTLLPSGCEKTANGRLSTGADGAER